MVIECRACMSSTSTKYVQLDSLMEDEYSYLDYFNKCTQLHAATNDGLSNKLCKSCTDLLQSIYFFVKLAVKVDKDFRAAKEYLKNDDTEVNRVKEEILPTDDMICIESSPKNVNLIADKVTKLDDSSMDEDSDSCSLLAIEIDILKEIDDECTVESSESDFGSDFNVKKKFRKDSLIDGGESTNNNQKENGESLYCCEFCDHRGFRTLEQKRSHKLKDHKTVECNICKNIILQRKMKEHMAVHERRKERSSKWNCSYCSETFPNIKMLTNHEITSHINEEQNPRNECAECSKKFFKYISLRQHIERQHMPDKIYKCPKCSVICPTSTQWDRHRRTHRVIKKHYCEICNSGFERPSELKRHSLKHTSEKPYACDECGRPFASETYLKNHKLTHLDIKEKCPICGQELRKKCLPAHLMGHKGGRFRCEICENVGFTKRERFAKHMKKVHNKDMTVEELKAIGKKYKDCIKSIIDPETII